MRLISNVSLKLKHIPPPSADANAIERFAQTFSGYEHCGSFDKCAEVANSRKHDTLSDLRTCLYFEQRRWHHFGDVPDAEALAYWKELVESIRSKVLAGETA